MNGHDFERRFSAEHNESLVLRHDMGAAIDAVVAGGAEYGSNAVEQLAGYLGFSVDRLYKLRKYARVFGREEVERLAARRMANGGRIRFHHLTAIMVVKSAQDRTRLIERVLKESLSVRRLRALILAEDGGAEAVRAERRPKSVLEGLTQVIARSQRLTTSFSKWKPEVFDLLGQQWSEDMRQQIRNRAAVAKDVIDALTAELRQATRSITVTLIDLSGSRARSEPIDVPRPTDLAPQRPA